MAELETREAEAEQMKGSALFSSLLSMKKFIVIHHLGKVQFHLQGLYCSHCREITIHRPRAEQPFMGGAGSWHEV